MSHSHGGKPMKADRSRKVTHSCKLEDFGCQIFQNGGYVDCGLGSYAHLVLGVVLEETLDTTAGELWKSEMSAWNVSFAMRAQR